MRCDPLADSHGDQHLLTGMPYSSAHGKLTKPIASLGLHNARPAWAFCSHRSTFSSAPPCQDRLGRGTRPKALVWSGCHKAHYSPTLSIICLEPIDRNLELCDSAAIAVVEPSPSQPTTCAIPTGWLSFALAAGRAACSLWQRECVYLTARTPNVIIDTRKWTRTPFPRFHTVDEGHTQVVSF